MNGNEIQRLAHAINAHRPDWIIQSLTTFISRHMAAWTYRDAAVALTYVACDAKPDGQAASDTPKRVLEQGPWRLAASVGGDTSQRAHAPKLHEECPAHPGSWAHNCGLCRNERYGGDVPADLIPNAVRVAREAAERARTRSTP